MPLAHLAPAEGAVRRARLQNARGRLHLRGGNRSRVPGLANLAKLPLTHDRASSGLGGTGAAKLG